MKQKKYTRRSLCMSILSMLLCCSMLVGTTFAWFTDSVTSGKNKIVAGNLDVELEYQNAKAASFSKVTEDTEDLFVSADGGDILWEPGVAAVTYLKLKNVGTLALKYVLSVLADDVETGSDGAALSDVLKSAVVEIEADEVGTYDRAKAIEAAEAADAESLLNYKKVGTMEPGEGSTLYFAAIVYFPEEIGNTVGGKLYNRGDVTLETDLSISLFATQAVSESDSFDNTYDKDAPDKDGGSLSVGSVTEKVTGSASSVTLDVNGLTPAGEGKTEVVFEEGALPFESSVTEHTVTLTVFTENIVEANPDFTVDESGMGAVASIDLTLTVDGSAVHTFAGGKGATVTTYIEKNLRDVTVKYGDEEISGVTYVPETGELTFQAKHFSKYTVYAVTETTAEGHPDEEEVPGENEIWIYNEIGLRNLSRQVGEGNSFKGKTIVLKSDIDLGNRPFNPIGFSDHPFSGTFNGNEKTIKNLTINQKAAGEGYNQHLALFGLVNGATITDFTIENATVYRDTGTQCVSAVVGESFPSALISKVNVTGHVIIGGMQYVGGIIGKGYVKVENCSVEADDTSLITNYWQYLGGIAGWLGEGSSYIKGCYSNIDLRVTAAGYSAVGAITGITQDKNLVENCTADDVNISVERTFGASDAEDINGIGAIAGRGGQNVTIKDCHGKVSITTVNGQMNNQGYVGNAKENKELTGLTLEGNDVTIIWNGTQVE